MPLQKQKSIFAELHHSFFSPSLAVSCRKQDGGQADIEACLKFASSMPSLTQPCQVPCQEDCQLSSWSKFSSCTADCVGVRTRKRMLVGESPTSSNFSVSSADVKTYCYFSVCEGHHIEPFTSGKFL